MLSSIASRVGRSLPKCVRPAKTLRTPIRAGSTSRSLAAFGVRHYSGPSQYDVFADGPPRKFHNTRVTEYTEHGFRINDDLVVGACIVTPDAYYKWNVKRFDDITVESMVILQLLNPSLDILLVGCGMETLWLDSSVRKYAKECGTVIDIMSSVNAASTFNILNQEDRNVGAAMLPINARQ
eukprot:GFYU01010369.1.p1 GENE.GFYU01010369.1~~GFYU01010369.1.p1  ORF type:complete len:181 (-),score=14.79 GFYU01010369.1:172-714(-)